MAKIVKFGDHEMAPATKDDKNEIGTYDNVNNYIKNEENESITIIPKEEETNKLERLPILLLLKSETYVDKVKIIGIKRVQLNKRSSARFMFVTKLIWNNGNETFISRDHADFFRYHCWLLDSFKAQAGLEGKPRTIPVLPGEKWFQNSQELAEQRRPLIENYLNKLIKIDEVANSYQAQAFFGPRPGDPDKDDVMDANFFQQMGNENDTKKEQDSSKTFYQGAIKGSHDNLTFQDEDDPKENDLVEDQIETDTNKFNEDVS